MDPFKQEAGKKEVESGVEIREFQPRQFAAEPSQVFERTRNEFNRILVSDSESSVPFNLNPASRRSLGIENEDQKNLEIKVTQEVDKREARIRDQAWAAGFEQGRAEGEKKAHQEFNEKSQPVFEQFLSLVQAYDRLKEEVYVANEQFLVDLVFQVSRKLMLRDLRDDREYVKNLCAQMVERVGARDHVKIKIGRDDFTQLESIREQLKLQFPDLKNIQIEVQDEIVNGGCKVETDLARIDATVDRQMEFIHQSLSGT